MNKAQNGASESVVLADGHLLRIFASAVLKTDLRFVLSKSGLLAVPLLPFTPDSLASTLSERSSTTRGTMFELTSKDVLPLDKPNLFAPPARIPLDDQRFCLEGRLEMSLG